MAKRHQELRCFCSRHPLLATYGVDEVGSLYIHVKVFKQGRIYGELVVTDGTVRMRCRDCYRWHRVFIRQDNTPVLREDRSISAPFPPVNA